MCLVLVSSFADYNKLSFGGFLRFNYPPQPNSAMIQNIVVAYVLGHTSHPGAINQHHQISLVENRILQEWGGPHESVVLPKIIRYRVVLGPSFTRPIHTPSASSRHVSLGFEARFLSEERKERVATEKSNTNLTVSRQRKEDGVYAATARFTTFILLTDLTRPHPEQMKLRYAERI
jgi:hypothetical protein